MTLNPAHEGVRRINIYLLRLLYGLMFFVLGQTCLSHILHHTGAWDPTDAVAWCVWTGFATLAGSSAEYPTSDFVWVIFPIVALPWGHVFTTYVYSRS